MKWFKFYGQDFLTDTKMKTLSVEKRQCWVILLCLANAEEKDGKIRNIIEQEVIQMAGIEYDGQTWHETLGFIIEFKKLEMITIDNVDNNGTHDRYDITLRNYKKRQETQLTGYERVKRYRENKAKNSEKKITPVDVINDNGRVDKSRIDNKEVEKSQHSSFEEEVVPTDDDGNPVKQKTKTKRNQTALGLQKYYNLQARKITNINTEYGNSFAGYTMICRVLKENSEKEVRKILDYYLDSKKFDEFPMMTAALSQDSIRRYKEDA